VVLANPAFYRQLGLDEKKVSGRRLEDVIADEELRELILDISRGKYVDYEDIPTYEFAVSEEKYLLARGQPVIGGKGECLGAVVSFVNITAMKVLDRIKTEFLAKVSHELRSPLSTIHEQLAVVLQDMVSEESRDQHLLVRAKEKTQGLISLIGDLLDLSRIETGAVCQQPTAVQLGELLKSIVDFLDTRAKSKKQRLTLELPREALPSFTADPLALESIVGNLITNAINYTQEGGKISVSADFDQDFVRIEVKDNGFGIEAKDLDKIFERFYRVKNESTRYITGTGLGLPIVKGLVDSLGGQISVESQPGIGSTFTVQLPVPEA
jgi:signal transduction histidine kinase